MRTMTLICSITTALLGSAACKRTDSEQSATEMRKAEEHVSDERRDVQEQKKHRHEQHKELREAKREVANPKAKFESDMTQRLARIDTSLAELEANPEPEAKKYAVAMRSRRAEIQRKLDSARDSTQSSFDALKKHLNESVETLETDIIGARQ